MTTPARPRSRAVYRRRRLTLVAVLLIVAGVVWLLVAQPWRGDAAEVVVSPSPSAPSTRTAIATPSGIPTTAPTDTAPPTDTPPPSETAPAASATPAETSAATPACRAADLTVEAVTDATEYAAGQNPQLSIRLTNRATHDCTMNVGTTGQVLTVLSGEDVWWRSTDCQTDSADQIATIPAGKTVTSVTPVTWDRTRSSVDTCATTRQGAPAGGATYRLRVSIGGVVAAPDATFLLY